MVGLRTEIAGTADTLASALNTVLRDVRLAPGDYVPELMPPDEPSTGGGIRALQRVRLVPERASYPTLVIGNVNITTKTGELRGYAVLEAIHRRRFKQPLPLVRADYEALVTRMQALLRALDVVVVVNSDASGLDDAAPEPTPGSPRRGSAVATGLTLLVVALVAAAAVAALAWAAGARLG